jgi:hypothetical protein
MIDKCFLSAPVASMLKDNLFTMTTEKENAVVDIFMDWLNNYARLKPVPDLADRIIKMVPRLRKLAKNMEVSIEEGKLVIRSDADSETLLNVFRRGSSWFDPHPDVNAAILLALANGANAS